MNRTCDFDIDFDDEKGIHVFCGKPAIGAAYDGADVDCLFVKAFYCVDHKPIIKDFSEDGE